LLEAIVDSAPVAMIVVDCDGRFVFVNREAQNLFGYSREELLGKPVETLLPLPLRDRHGESRHSFFAAPYACRMASGSTLHALCKNGTHVPVEIALKPLTTPDGVYILAVVADISERQRLERRFEVAVEAAPIAMLMVDQHGSIVLVNHESEKLYGNTRSELVGRPVEALVPQRLRPHDQATRERFFAAPIARRMGAGHEFLGMRKDGTEVPIELGLNPVVTDDGQFVLMAIEDISERKRLETAVRDANEELERRVEERTAELARANRNNEALLERLQVQRLDLERLSREDPLTQLANRRDFDERLGEEIRRAQRFGTPLAVAMLDLDQFKLVNDRFGHAVGDRVLRETATLLRRECRKIDSIARYGGEEFALALPGSDLAAAVTACQRIRAAFERFDWNAIAAAMRVTISAGISVWTAGADADHLLAQADAKLYEAKHNGRNCVMPAVAD
jgi:diguanylate cyclase (GGDEF)-like protein/PAS domain S-box-containing protein